MALTAGELVALPGQIVSFEVDTGGVTKGHVVYISAANKVKNCTAGHAGIGVAMQTKEAGEQVGVLMGCPIINVNTTAAAVGAGVWVAAAAGGAVVAATLTAKATGLDLQYIVGIAVTAIGSTGGVISVALMPGLSKDTGYAA